MCPSCGKQYPASTRFCTFDGTPLMHQMPDPLIGTLLPRHYRITERLGRGAMSVVYRGVYEPLNQPVAVKLLKSHLVSDLQTFKRFQQEAKTAGALDHPNIVSVFDFGVTEQGVPYLIMELVLGESLYDMLRKAQPVAIDSALRIFSQTADALEYTHERGVVHRDVKPSNILVVPDEQGREIAKLLDFGIAKLQHYEGNPSANLTQTGEVFGTPLYVSPEQAMGRPLDARADIYSLGCVMYETITGTPPFQGTNAFDVLRLQIQGQAEPMDRFRPLEELPPSLVAAVNRAMRKAPEDRQQSMAELVIELQHAELELTVAGETLSGPRSRSEATPTEGVRSLPISGRFANADAQRQQNVSQAGLKAADGKVPSLYGMRAAGDAAAAPQGKSPLVPFLLSSLAGMLVGVVILFVTHGFNAAKPLAVSNRVSEHPGVDAGVLDAELAGLREQALQSFDNHQLKVADEQVAIAIDAAQAKGEKVGVGLLLADKCMIEIEMKKYSDAFEAGTAAVAALDKQPGVPKKELSFALRGLGTACYYRNDFGMAESLLKRSTALDKEVYGESDERYAIGLARLAKVLESEKKYGEAEAAYRSAMQVSQKCHQPGDSHLSGRMMNLADFLRARKRTADAQELERQARALQQAESSAQ